MTRTYDQKGLKGFKRQTPTHHGHCFICGWDPQFSTKRRTRRAKILKFDVNLYVEYYMSEKTSKKEKEKNIF